MSFLQPSNDLPENRTAAQEAAATHALYSDIESYSFMVSHELKTPIREIDLYAEFIEEDNIGQLSEQSVEDLHSIRRICQNMVQSFQNIMDYGRAERKKLHLETVVMTDVIRSTFHQLMEEFPGRQVKLELQPLPELLGDTLLIRQMVSNILSNSIKYTEYEPNPVIRVSAYQEQDSIFFRFQDNGIGFESGDSTQAFNLFERLHNPSDFSGNGIGLALVRKIADRFEAQVEILGKPNQGCTVVVGFPQKYVIGTSTKNSLNQQTQGTIRIGIIDDFSSQYAYLSLSKKAACELAIEEINQRGGILNKPVELIFRDDQSNILLSEEHARTLTEIEHVDAIFGGCLSPNREAIRGVVDQTKTPYFYTEHYEGGVADHYTFCIGSVPEHTIYPALDYFVSHIGKRFYLLVADYIWGILVAEGVKNHLRKIGGDVVAVEYISLKKRNFRVTVENIVEDRPDVLIFLGIGDNNHQFYHQWKQYGLLDIPVLTPNSINEAYLHKRFEPPIMENAYFMTSFLEELDTQKAISFCKKFRARHPQEEVPHISSEAEVIYSAMHLYRNAVEMAGTTETEAVIQALESDEISYDGPGGTVYICGSSHHVMRDVRLFRVARDHTVEELAQFCRSRSTFVEDALNRHMGVNSLKKLGTHAPNLQYSLMYNKYINTF